MRQLEKFLNRVFSPEHLALYGRALAIAVVGYLIARAGGALLQRFYGRRLSEHGQMVVGRAFFYVVFITSIIGAVNHLGVDLSALIAAAGVAGVAISFAAQTSVSNVISGIFLLFDRPFSLGDTIRVDQTLGNVLSIDLLSSKLRTFDNLVVRIPNEVMLKSTIINYSLLQVRRVEIPVVIAHENDVAMVSRLIMQCAMEAKDVLDEPAPIVLTDLIQDQGIQFLVRAWVERIDYVQVRSDLSTQIIEALNTHGVKRPIMRRTVVLTQQEEPLRVAHVEAPALSQEEAAAQSGEAPTR